MTTHGVQHATLLNALDMVKHLPECKKEDVEKAIANATIVLSQCVTDTARWSKTNPEKTNMLATCSEVLINLSMVSGRLFDDQGNTHIIEVVD